jgi:hypothetical protein
MLSYIQSLVQISFQMVSSFQILGGWFEGRMAIPAGYGDLMGQASGKLSTTVVYAGTLLAIDSAECIVLPTSRILCGALLVFNIAAHLQVCFWLLRNC